MRPAAAEAGRARKGALQGNVRADRKMFASAFASLPPLPGFFCIKELGKKPPFVSFKKCLLKGGVR
ncbi:MAG: hypothetical protein CW342_09320 [Thermoactinomycetaceae bacterium]|nr:hypothetical protein [Thermoactinomycetaceae bacterium]